MDYTSSIVAFTLVIFQLWHSTEGVEWDYGTKGPESWPYLYSRYCSLSGQSPVNINKTLTQYDSGLQSITFSNYGSEIEYTFLNSYTKKYTPTTDVETNFVISGSDFNSTYRMIQFHFHWGQNAYSGSEHFVDDVSYPLELHLVHVNTNGNGNDLAVLGFLFVVSSEDNAALDPLITPLANTATTSGTLNFNINSILPSDLTTYYRYHGSLTTPPCTESVTWTVFTSAISISEAQLSANFWTSNTKFNWRPPQNLNGRVVRRSFSSQGRNQPVNIGFYLLASLLAYFMHKM